MSRAGTHRLFVAVYLDADFLEPALSRARALDLPAHRPTPIQQIHLTVLFIGEVNSKDLPACEESVERAAAGLPPFDLVMKRLISLPERGHARLIALETDAPPPLLEFRSRLVRAFAKTARVKPNDRFLPHLTLLRFRSPAPGPRTAIDLEPVATSITSATLVRSVLLHAGAEHRAVRVASFTQ